MTCRIANEFGANIDMSGQPEYDEKVYQMVFKKILKNRHFVPLIIDEIYSVPEQSEDVLHGLPSRKASEQEANYYGELVRHFYSDLQEMDELVAQWYLT
jgi:hypothetical protein